jgi:hypothetical protein
MYWLAKCELKSCEWMECSSTADDAHGFRWMHESQCPGHAVGIIEYDEIVGQQPSESLNEKRSPG